MKKQLPLLICIAFFLFWNRASYGQAPSITATLATGTINSTQGPPSTLTQRFSVSGSNLSSDIIVTAPSYFEVSLAPGSGFGNSITLSPIALSVATTVIYVRSAASAPPGIISGGVGLLTTGAAQNVVVYGTINGPPVAIANQTVNHGDLTAAVNFGANWGCTYTWVNNIPTIGLPASGAGNISPFAAVNTGTTPVTATITAIPTPSVYAYIGNNNAPIVTLVNTLSNTVTKTWNLGKNEDDLSMNANSFAISADGKTVYAASSSANALAVIDAATGVVLKRHLNLPGVTSPILSTDGRYVYAALSGSSTVMRLQTSDNLTINNYTVGSGPTGLAISADGSNVYCANSTSKTVSIINTSTSVPTTPITLNETPGYMVIQDNVDGRFLYIANSKGVDIVDLNSLLIKTIPIFGGVGVKGLAIRPDGNKVYATNPSGNSVIPINTKTQTQEVQLRSNTSPESVSVSADNQRLYIVNTSGSVAVFNTITFDPIISFPLGSTGSASYGGNFISSMVNCTGGSPITFDITINPLPVSGTNATITTGTVSGTIITCAGTAGGGPSIAQFTFTGTNLTDNITLSAPGGFEISLNPLTGYNTVITAMQSGGNAAGTLYIRAAANAPAGAISGIVSLSSAGAATQTVTVTGTVMALPAVNVPANQNVVALGLSNAINFTGTFTSVTWTNNTPAIGLAATGTGNIPAFTPLNPGTEPLVATISVTPNNSNGCPASPVSFLITVAPAAAQVIALTGPVALLTTVYGTNSASATFTVAVTNMQGTVSIAAPNGFEVSFNNITFANGLSIPNSGTLPPTTIYVRISKTTPAGTYDGNVVVTGGGFIRQIALAADNLVTKAPLTVTADNKSRVFGAPNPTFTYTYKGFVNSEGPSVIKTPPAISTTATPSSAEGSYPITISGGTASNYSFSYIAATLMITPITDLIIKNTFTPNGDGVNDTWEIGNIEGHPNSVVEVYSRYGLAVFSSRRYSKPWDGKRKGVDVPVGMYYYIIDLKDGTKPVRGWLAIIR